MRKLDISSSPCRQNDNVYVEDDDVVDQIEDDFDDFVDRIEDDDLAAATFDIDKDEEREDSGGDHGGLHSWQHYH